MNFIHQNRIFPVMEGNLGKLFIESVPKLARNSMHANTNTLSLPFGLWQFKTLYTRAHHLHTAPFAARLINFPQT